MKKIILLLFTVPFLFSWTTVTHAENAPIKDEVIYKIFVDRFNNGDPSNSSQVNLDDPYAYHGGDLKGITKRLDYLKERGMTTISLSPIMENAKEGYHGYWITDFFALEKQFGTMDDLKDLVQEAHKKGMKVMLEFVPNFAAKSHPFAQDADKVIQNRFTDEMWLDQTAALNLKNKQVQETLLKAADFWLNEADIDGFNIHAMEQTPIDFLKVFENHVKETKSDIYLTGSVLNPDDLTEAYMDLGIPVENPVMHKAMIDVFAHAGTPVSDLYEVWSDGRKSPGILYLDNQLTKRFTREVIENKQSALKTWKLAITYMYTTPGIPELFQGSIIPMDGATPEETQQLVQFNHNDKDLQEFSEKIAWVRNKFPVLKHGDFELAGTSGAMSVFKRTDKDNTVFIAINNDTESRNISIDDVAEGMQLTGLLEDNIIRRNDQGKFRIGLESETAEIFAAVPDKGFNWLFISLIAGVFIVFAGAVYMAGRKQKKQKNN